MDAKNNGRPGEAADPGMTLDGLALIRLFARISSPADRQRVIALARELSPQRGAGTTPPG